MIASSAKLLLGLLAGIVFGFLLQKGQAGKYRVILGQLLLKDWTVATIMGTAVVVGSVGVYALHGLGVTPLAVKPMVVGAVLVGAVLFGAGMALLGYCPGTSLVAAAEGRRDAAVGIVGMFAGAMVYVLGYATFEPLLRELDLGKVTWPAVTGTTPWLWVGSLVAIAGVVAVLRARRGGSTPLLASEARVTRAPSLKVSGAR